MSAGEAAAFIRQHRRFLLLCHVSPDGDALGSSLALGLALEAAGREWTAACDTVCYPHKYAFLPGADRVHVGTPVTPEPDTALIFVDCASADRAGLYASLLEEERPTLCIDHHITNPGCKGQGYAGVNYVEDCAAAGELVYLLIRELGVPLTADMAACLYTALSTDTGNFAYDSVTKRTFCIMGALLEAGLDLPQYNQLLFRQERLAKTRLRARAVEHMTLYEENTVAVASLTLGEIEAAGGVSADCDGIIDTLRDIETVEAACFIRESTQGLKVSLRSKGHLNVAELAGRFGGGGHVLAAGCTLLHMTMEEACSRMSAVLCEAWRESRP